MTHVTDEQLGKIARQQADLFRRVREGSIDVGYASRGLQNIIEEKCGKLTDLKVGNTYPVSVNYVRSIEDGIRAGQYDSRFICGSFSMFCPAKKMGISDRVIEIIHFDRKISTEDALMMLDIMGYRPAGLHELLAFGERYPNVQREYPVVALGTFMRNRDGIRVAPCLYGDSSKRVLETLSIEIDWEKAYRFAVLRK